ncbi:hypothetical protein ACTQ4E_01105 [Lawsonibacter sp. LCP25S3_G6]|uniref:hypothetical protein n=1 Tax=unclassified Lawsonibacter TaxID=2617946 RepID=UPI003F96186F
MATNHTANYQLNQWEATDQVLRTDFNDDNAKIDTALKSLNTTAQQHTTQLSQLQTSLSKCGDCKLHYTTYVGDGGSSRTFTFPKKPVFLFLFGGNNINLMIPGTAPHTSMDGFAANLSWSGNSLTMTIRTSEPSFNFNNMTYYLLALLNAAE